MKTVNRLDIEDARTLIKDASERANVTGLPMCIAVTDEGGLTPPQAPKRRLTNMAK